MSPLLLRMSQPDSSQSSSNDATAATVPILFLTVTLIPLPSLPTTVDLIILLFTASTASPPHDPHRPSSLSTASRPSSSLLSTCCRRRHVRLRRSKDSSLSGSLTPALLVPLASFDEAIVWPHCHLCVSVFSDIRHLVVVLFLSLRVLFFLCLCCLSVLPVRFLSPSFLLLLPRWCG